MERLTQLGHRIGRGGIATVYRHPTRSSQVIKLFEDRPDLFSREADLHFQLPFHPGICQCLGTVNYEDYLDNNYFGLIFPYYKWMGLPLAGDRFSPSLFSSKALKLIGSIAWTLIAVHNAGLVHLDINQRNIMCSDDDEAVLIDFGAAMQIGARPRFPIGTPGYRSPEVVLMEPIDQRNDIFSLGMVLYEIMTKLNPLNNQRLDSDRSQIQASLRSFKREVENSLPAPLAKLVNKMTAFNMDERFKNAAETYLAIIKTIYLLEQKRLEQANYRKKWGL